MMRISLMLVFITACVVCSVQCNTNSHRRLRSANATEPQRPAACDDSCEFASDGTCDDGSVDNSSTYYNADEGGSDTGDSNYYSYGAPAEEDGSYESNIRKGFPCRIGTDCTDCGGKVVGQPIVCENTCIYRRDGVCDDTRGVGYCALGTDCQDCGPVGASNFTSFDLNHNDTSYDDDDDYWTFNDVLFISSEPSPHGDRFSIVTSNRYKRDFVDGNTIAFYLALVLIVALAAVPMLLHAHHMDKSVSQRAAGINNDASANTPGSVGGGGDYIPPHAVFAVAPLPLPAGVTNIVGDVELARVLRDSQGARVYVSTGLPELEGGSVKAFVLVAAPGNATVLY